MTTKTYYFTIDGDDGEMNECIDARHALDREHDYPTYSRAAFSVTYDTDTYEWGTPERLQEPVPKYWYRDLGSAVYNCAKSLNASYRSHEETIIYREADNGDLIVVDDEEKAKAIELWRARKLA